MPAKNCPGAGTIRRRPNGLWEARYTAGRTPEGKQLQRSVYAHTRAEVSKQLLSALKLLEDGGCIIPSRITLGEWLERWLDDYVAPFLRQSTVINYRGYLNNHILPALGQVRLKDLTAEALQRFYNRCAQTGNARCPGKPLSPKTMQNLHNMLHQALDQACKNQLLPRNVADNVVLPRLKRREMRVLSREEQRQLTALWPTEPLGFAILFDLSTGLRLGELCGLKWSDIDFAQRTLCVRRSIRRLPVEAPRPGAPATRLCEFFPKTEASLRAVPIQASIFNLLLRHRGAQAQEKASAGAQYDDRGFIFASPLGGVPDPYRLRSAFERLQRAAGIPYANFHALRHTFATRAIESGVSVKAVSDILGHTTTRLTMDLYCHSSMDLKRSAVDSMATLWEGAEAL